MNTIKDLAVQWWESLPIKRNKELLFKYHPDESLDYKKIENIFYNEVILKWAANNPASVFDSTEERIKERYLKEHSKEEPKPTVQEYEQQGLEKYLHELKQETLEKEAGWEPESIYSEEEVYSLLEQSMKDCHLWELEEHYSGDYKNLKKWFEQFKKK